MSWWKKERDLSIEEALEKTKQEFAPYWLKTDPLIVGVFDPETKEVQAFPLAKNFGDTPYLLFFFDLTSPTTEAIFGLSKEWGKRFKAYQLNFIFVFKQSYQFFRNKFLIRQTLDKYKINEITVLDHENLLSRAFLVREFPSIALYYKGEIIFHYSLLHFTPEIETRIHNFLRTLDPGLSLSPPFEPSDEFYKDLVTVEFGKDRFASLEKGPPPDDLEPGVFYQKGKWVHDPDSISTADMTAELVFKSTYPHVFIFARSLSKIDEPARIVMSIDESPVFDMFFAKDIAFDEAGNSTVMVKEGRIYACLYKLPKDKRVIKLRFPTGRKAPIALYSITFCS